MDWLSLGIIGIWGLKDILTSLEISLEVAVDNNTTPLELLSLEFDVYGS